MTNDSKQQEEPQAERGQQLEQNELDWVERISPPMLPADATTACVMAARNGRFYAAPIGTDPFDPAASDHWTSISSLAELADLLRVEWSA